MFADDSLRPARRRTVSPASLIDGISVTAFIAVLSFLFFAGRIESPVLALVPSVLFTGAATLIFLQIQARRRRLKRIALERLAYDLWLTDDLLRAEPAKFNKFALSILLFQCHWRYVPPEDGGPFLTQDDKAAELALLRRHPSAPVGAQDVLECIDRARAAGRGALVVATTAGITDEARKFAGGVPDVDVRFYDGQQLAAMAWDGACAPPPDALEPYLEEAGKRLRSKKRTRRVFANWAVSIRFIGTAGLLTAMSWLTPYRHWYLICAALCLAFGAAALLFPNRGPFRRLQSR